MKIIIGLDDLDIIIPETNRIALKLFHKKLHKYLRMYEATEIITNAHIGSALQEMEGYQLPSIISGSVSFSGSKKPDPYLIGNIDVIKVYVDPMMLWTDNRIIIKGSDVRLRREKILKMKGEKEFEDFLEEIIVDEKLLNMLL